MTKRIFVLVQPFDQLQNVEVFDGNSIIETIQISMAEIPEQLCLFAKKYSITEIDLLGPSKYTKRIGQETKKEEIEKYQNNILTFKYI